MLINSKRQAWWKGILLCLLMAAVIAIPSETISAKTTSARTLLKNTITYCGKLDKSKYTTASWATFQKKLKESNAVYYKTKKKDSIYSTALDELEKAKAELAFVSTTSKGNPSPFTQLTVDQMVKDMGAGWNLGNTMDGHSGFTPNETLWQNTVTTKSLIKSVHDMGFNTVRIPVTWGTKIDDENGYAIDDAWMSRVQDIVDYAIAQDMYVIINIHHDGAEQSGWLRVGSNEIDPVYNKFEIVWRNIAQKFKDYDEHLIFESMNEVKGDDKTTTQKHDIQVIMNLNQIFVNVVRSTGSNNSNRWLSVPGRYTNIETSTDKKLAFNIPKDTVKDRLFVSVHDYIYTFGLLESMGDTRFDKYNLATLGERIQLLVDKFTSKGIPVIMGEYGAANKNNTPERAYYYEAMTKMCQRGKIVACAWDNGGYDNNKKPDYTMCLIDRANYKEPYPDIVNAILRGTFVKSTSKSYADVKKNPTKIKMTDVTLSDTALSMKIGDSKNIVTTVKPDNTNDVVIWKTADPTIATVYNGHVRAKGIGTTTLTAYSRYGSINKTVTVAVNAMASSKPCTSIKTDSDSYSLIKSKYVNIKASLEPADTDAVLTYKSSDESVATVSNFGKIVGCEEGTAYITITASTGLTRTVKVTVAANAVETKNELTLALDVLYNDNAIKFYGNEVGAPITITENGQYKLSFDCASNLSKAAVKTGVNSLKDMTAIYIKDYSVTTGKASKSPLVSCDIMYDKITVNGTNLTITQKAPKTAIKSSGILDTNDPLNGWEGSSVKETSVKDHTVNITGIKDPTKIEITFTISNLVFKGQSKETKPVKKPVAATAITASTKDMLVLNKVGDTATISALLTPSDATTSVTFVSSDSSVVSVDNTAVTADSTGKVTRTLTAMSNGTATITAYTKEGLTTTYQVKVGN